MSTDNNQLPPLPEPAQSFDVFEAFTADQMHAYARAALSASSAAEPVGRNREADRQAFGDPDFNRWLDESVTENGEFTVWHSLKNTLDAYTGFGACLDYISKQAAPATAEAVAWQWRIDGGAEWHPASREWAERIMAGQGAQGMQARALGVITATAEAKDQS